MFLLWECYTKLNLQIIIIKITNIKVQNLVKILKLTILQGKRKKVVILKGTLNHTNNCQHNIPNQN